MARRCSPCFGVWVDLFLAACKESPADFVLTKELLRTRTNCRIAREVKRTAVMRSNRRLHDVGSIGTNGMGEDFRQNRMDVCQRFRHSLSDDVLVHRVAGGCGPEGPGTRGSQKKSHGTLRADISLGVDGIGSGHYFGIFYVLDGRGG